MNFVIGDTFVLKAAAIDPQRFDPENPTNPDAILYPPGTEAIIERIGDDVIYLKMPDGEIIPNDPTGVYLYYNRKVDQNLVYMKETIQSGTPKPGLVPYLPAEANWKHKYRIKVIVELEDRGEKESMCPQCLEEILLNKEQDENGLTMCDSCGTLVTPIVPE